MLLLDYQKFKSGDYYIIAMAGGDGEEAQPPIREHVFTDKQRCEGLAATRDEAMDILLTSSEDWVDMLEVWRGDDLIAMWSRGDGWRTL